MTGENCRQYPFAFIGRVVYPVRGEGVKEGDGGDRYFSPLQRTLCYRT